MQQSPWNVLPENDISETFDALNHTIKQAAEKAARRTMPTDKTQWENSRGTLRQALGQRLGLLPMPPKTPLNAQTTGTAERENYTIENVVFESRPNFLVTANLYLPKNAPDPMPAIVVVPGHAMAEGKNYPLYQMAQLGLVNLGFVVLAYDPIGQGERRHPGFAHDLGYPALMTGLTNEAIIAWDTIRAVDYLTSRPEVDGTRIGLTGNSGGGENTFYTMPFDDRIQAGAAFCFVCSYEQWLLHGGNHCICNHFPGIVDDIEQFEIVALNAPRPFLLGNASEDPIFPIKGTRQTFERAQRIYGFYEAPDRVRAVETPGGHGWSQPLREAAYGWFAKWLQGKGDGTPITEPEGLTPEEPTSPDVLCFDEGALPPSETVTTITRARAIELRTVRTPSRESILQAFAIDKALPELSATEIREFAHGSVTVRTLAIQTGENLSIPANLLLPQSQTKRCVVVVTDKPREAVAQTPLIQQLLERGTATLIMNPRGVGEVTQHENHLVSDTIVLGKPLLGQMAQDVAQTARWLEKEGFESVALFGEAACGVIALLAAVIHPHVARVGTLGTPDSFEKAIAEELIFPRWLYVPNIFRACDIGDLVKLGPPALESSDNEQLVNWLSETGNGEA